jgi:hypothetical protein
MNHLFNPKYIIAFAGLMFCVAYIDSLSVHNLSYSCAFQCLHTIGKIAVVLFCVALAWLILSTLFKLGR